MCKLSLGVEFIENVTVYILISVWSWLCFDRM